MEIVELIQKKVNKQRFNQQDMEYVVKGIVDKTIPDYLITSWLMAIYINGLNIDEAYYLTKSMWLHSAHIDLSGYGQHIMDKHSTGGIGDKVSLILTPIMASLDIPIAKISGRGLGFTGGTIDKLESIGMNTNLTVKQMLNQLKKHKMFIASQTETIAPVDKVLYNLRDVTGTVGDYGLIASSVLSKKFAILGTHVFIDVKYGSGAFCPTYRSALKLVKFLKGIAKRMKRKVTIMISGMDQPLGRNVGNAIEVLEAQDFLSGNVDYTKDLKELIYKLAATAYKAYHPNISIKKALAKVNDAVVHRHALKKFYEWIDAQGGNYKKVLDWSFWHPKYKIEIKCPKSGYLTFTSNSAVGMLACRLGAGRILKTDKVDPQAGMWWNFKHGDHVDKGDVIVTLFSSKPIDAKKAFKECGDCCKLVPYKPRRLPVVRKVIYDK